MPIEPYLNFDGRCEEAIEFYKKALGAEVTMLLRFNQNPEPPAPERQPHGVGEKVMHASLKINGAVVMLSDGYCKGNPNFHGITLSLSVKDAAAADKAFNALAEGGKIHMPLAKTFFSPRFGMLADKFGVPWMVIVPQHM
jgi:PhnB protein